MPTKEETSAFSLNIETLALNKRIPIMDAILEHCTKTGLEIEIAAKLVSPGLKKRLEIEARELNFLPHLRTKRLPV